MEDTIHSMQVDHFPDGKRWLFSTSFYLPKGKSPCFIVESQIPNLNNWTSFTAWNPPKKIQVHHHFPHENCHMLRVNTLFVNTLFSWQGATSRTWSCRMSQLAASRTSCGSTKICLSPSMDGWKARHQTGRSWQGEVGIQMNFSRNILDLNYRNKRSIEAGK